MGGFYTGSVQLSPQWKRLDSQFVGRTLTALSIRSSKRATQSERLLNKRGVRNIHRYEGDGFIYLTYERGAATESSWVVVSLLAEQVDNPTATVVLLVGGGGDPFKVEEMSMIKIVQGEDAVGQAGRFRAVLEDINRLCDSLELTVETDWRPDSNRVWLGKSRAR